MIDTGQPAPDFSAPDQNGDTVRRDDFSGRKLVLYFYPEDDTSGCTKEACGFRDALEQLEQEGVSVVGVSADTVESHRAFADTYDLSFPLLADPDKDIIEAYGASGAFGNAARVTVVIDEEGVVERVYEDVDPESHAAEIMEDL